MESVDTAKKALEVYEKALNTLLTGELTPEAIGEAAAGLKMLQEVLQNEEANRIVVIETLEEVKMKIIAEVSAFFKEEIKKITNNLQNTINQKLDLIPSADNLTKAYIYEKLTGGKII